MTVTYYTEHGYASFAGPACYTTAVMDEQTAWEIAKMAGAFYRVVGAE